MWLDLGRGRVWVRAGRDMQGNGHTQVEQYIGQRRPLGLLLVVLMRLDQCLYLIDDLPDPRTGAGDTAHKGQG